MKSIDSVSLKKALSDGREIALLDVREEVDYFPRHLLLASCAPLGRIETMIDDLVPRRSVQVVLMDAGEGYASRAGRVLEVFGYSDIAVLEGGIDAWAAAGYEVFSGMHVPSKAFGELVDSRCGTPKISAEELHRRISAGEEILILDSRPFEEYTRQSIPGGMDCPGGELVYRAYDLVKSPKTLVVVNCAGRTRSIIGSQSLVNAGIQNPVAALTNGTMGWHLAGFQLEKGATRRALLPSPAGIKKAQAAARRVADAAGVRAVDRHTYETWLGERSDRTTYVFDVRDREEFESGHLSEAVWAPGGQLVQETDRYAATRNARIVLVDDTGVRARMTGAWLRQMGWRDIFVFETALEGQKLATGRRRSSVLGLEGLKPRMIEPKELQNLISIGETVVLDFSAATRYRTGHIPGAFYILRANIPKNLETLSAHTNLVLTSSDGLIARFASAEIERATGKAALVLAGGTDAWRKAGLPLSKGEEAFLDKPRDVWNPYQRTEGAEEHMKAYIKWEVGLMEQVDRDGNVAFQIMTPS